MMVNAIREAAQTWADHRQRLDIRRDLSECVNTLPFVDLLIKGGAIADVSRPLTFDGRAFWRPIYASMYRPCFCVMSAAQLGKSMMLFYGLAAIAHLFHYRGMGIWHGLYLPTQEMVRVFSKGRLDPILRQVGEITGVRCGDVDADEITQEAGLRKRPAGTKNGKDSYNFKRIADSYVLLAWMQGALVDAFPLDVVVFDEVRLMDPGQVDRVEKRVTGSSIGWTGYTSRPACLGTPSTSGSTPRISATSTTAANAPTASS